MQPEEKVVVQALAFVEEKDGRLLGGAAGMDPIWGDGRARRGVWYEQYNRAFREAESEAVLIFYIDIGARFYDGCHILGPQWLQ